MMHLCMLLCRPNMSQSCLCSHVKHVSHSSMQELKGKFIIKGKRLNKLDAFFSKSNTIVEETVSEEDEAAESKENGQKAKSKVWQSFCNRARFSL